MLVLSFSLDPILLFSQHFYPLASEFFAGRLLRVATLTPSERLG
jgi:hypothetical protein